MKNKVLLVSPDDFDCYNDWVVGIAAERFVEGGYTHVKVPSEGQEIPCEVISGDMVMVCGVDENGNKC